MKRMPVVAILIVGLMLIAIVPSGVMAYTPQPARAPVEPNPMLEGNVTFANHTAGQAPLQYINQLGKPANLSAVLDGRVANPISLNTSDIHANATGPSKIGGNYWNKTASWAILTNFGSVATATATTVNGQPAITFEGNSSNEGSSSDFYSFSIAKSSLPSTNLAFDYVTVSGFFYGPATPGANVMMNIWSPPQVATEGVPIAYYSSNGSIAAQSATGATNAVVAPGSPFYFSVSLAQLNETYFASASSLNMNFKLDWTKGASTDYYITLTGMAVTTFPLTLGTTYWGGKLNGTMHSQLFLGDANLTALAPSFSYSYINSGGYTTAITEQSANLPNSDVTITQAAISGSTYVEQLTYSFLFGLPAAPSLTYSAFKLVDKPALAPAQYVSVTYAGTSYLGDYTGAHAKGNYTTLVSAASPTTSESWVGTVQYTQAQWDSISAPPGIFTVAGINYLWFVLIGVIAGLVGLGSAWASKGESGARIRGRGR